jgi:hypothetical protein
MVNYFIDSHPERWRDRPCETSATTAAAGANSGRNRKYGILEDEVQGRSGLSIQRGFLMQWK